MRCAVRGWWQCGCWERGPPFALSRDKGPAPFLWSAIMLSVLQVSNWISYFHLQGLRRGLPICSTCSFTPLPICLPQRFLGAPQAAAFLLGPAHLLQQLFEQGTPAVMTAPSSLKTQGDLQVMELPAASNLDCHHTPWAVHLGVCMSPERLCPLGLGCCLSLAAVTGAHHDNYKR